MSSSGDGCANPCDNKKVLHLEVGQPETGAPEVVASAACAALKTSNSKSRSNNVMGYTDAFGLIELRQKIRQHVYIEKYCLAQQAVPDPSEIVITTGSSGAFLLAFTGCFDSNDTVAIASSGYPCYRNILQALGA